MRRLPALLLLALPWLGSGCATNAVLDEIRPRGREIRIEHTPCVVEAVQASDGSLHLLLDDGLARQHYAFDPARPPQAELPPLTSPLPAGEDLGPRVRAGPRGWIELRSPDGARRVCAVRVPCRIEHRRGGGPRTAGEALYVCVGGLVALPVAFTIDVVTAPVWGPVLILLTVTGGHPGAGC